MKKVNLSVLLILLCYVCFSQNKQLLYGLKELPQNLLINPGSEVDYKWHAGLPLLSQIHVSAGSSGLALNDIFADNGIDFNQRIRNIVNDLSSRDFFTVNQQLEIFSGGFKTGKQYVKDTYISFGLYQEADAIIYFPKDFAVLFLEGNQNNIDRVFDLSDLNLRADLISVLHLGYNKKVNDKFTYGVRGKIYSSLASISSINNNGSFVTRQGDNNFLTHTFNLDLQVRTSGISSLINNNSDASSNINDFRSKLFLGGDLGLGLDAGFTYRYSDQLSIDASVQDLGFINHTKDLETLSIDGNLVFEGVNPVRGTNVDDASEDFESLFEIDTTATKFVTTRPVKFNGAVRYAFERVKDKNCNCVKPEKDYLSQIGAQLYAIKRPVQPQLALSLYYYRKIFGVFRTKLSYTIDSFSKRNIGFGLSTHIGSFNFYVTADNLLEYENLANAQSLSLQFGFNLIFN